MNFASDNAGPAHPRVMQALINANAGHAMPYGNDPLTAEVTQKIRDLFEAPEAAVHLVATGTACNALILATMAQPWQTVFCADCAHVEHDECGAPEFYSGAKLTPVPTLAGKMTPGALSRAVSTLTPGNVHSVQPGPVTITQITETGTCHTLDELRALTAVAKAAGLPVHLDGARFANAIATLGCSPADMTWRLGVDAVSFGGTKNGLLGVEAAVIFDPAKSWEFQLRRKRGAHLFSKNRYLAAQMHAYLMDDLWLEMASAANAACAMLHAGLDGAPGVTLLNPPDANMLFARLPRAAHRRLHDAGAQYYLMEGALEDGPEDEPLKCRLVCDWSVGAQAVERFAALVRG